MLIFLSEDQLDSTNHILAIASDRVDTQTKNLLQLKQRKRNRISRQAYPPPKRTQTQLHFELLPVPEIPHVCLS